MMVEKGVSSSGAFSISLLGLTLLVLVLVLVLPSPPFYPEMGFAGDLMRGSNMTIDSRSSHLPNWMSCKKPLISTRRNCNNGIKVCLVFLSSSLRSLLTIPTRFPQGLPQWHPDKRRIPEDLPAIFPLWRSIIICKLCV